MVSPGSTRLTDTWPEHMPGSFLDGWPPRTRHSRILPLCRGVYCAQPRILGTASEKQAASLRECANFRDPAGVPHQPSQSRTPFKKATSGRHVRPAHAAHAPGPSPSSAGWLRSLSAAAFVRHFGQQLEVDGLGNVHELLVRKASGASVACPWASTVPEVRPGRSSLHVRLCGGRHRSMVAGPRYTRPRRRDCATRRGPCQLAR